MDLKEKEKGIPEFRQKFKEQVQDIIEEGDPRDITRILEDDEYAILFLIWSRNIDNAVKSALDVVKWRNEYKVNDMTAENIGIEKIQEGNLFLLGRAVNGKRILYFRGGKLKKEDHEENKRLLIFWLERIQRKESGWDARIIFFLDTNGSSIGNSNITFIKFMISCFSTYFPCLLDKIIVYNLPFLMNSVWKLISKMLTQEQREGTILCGSSEVQKYIDLSQLPVDMGGHNTFKFSYPPFPDDLGN